MRHLFDTGYTRLLQKLGRSGRLMSTGANEILGYHSYTMCYMDHKTGKLRRFSVFVNDYDYFTRPCAKPSKP